MSAQFLLAAASRPYDLIGRVEQMERIKQAMYGKGRACRVVLIEGSGGLGKTRLLEEALRRMGHKALRGMYGTPTPAEDWSRIEPAVLFADLLDLVDVRLHTREYLLEKLGDPETWDEKIAFSDYQMAHDRWRRVADAGAAYTLAGPASEAAEAAFWEDFQAAARKCRLVIPIDTTEQLATISSEWLIQKGLLRPEDLTFNTQQWLLDQIHAGRFVNTTLLIAGREKKGGPYFELLRQAVQEAGKGCELISIRVPPFTEDETRQYFQAICDDSASLAQGEEARAAASHIRHVLSVLTSNEDHLKAFWLYTGGQPIRLALYTDILVEGRVPEPLQDTSFEEARKRTDSDGTTETPALTKARQEIEAEFVQILFGAGSDLRARILHALARSKPGLTAEQLHFILDSEPTDTAEEWQADPQRMEEIRSEMESLRVLSIIKPKPGGRLVLQDEMYRIYAEAMSAEEETRQKEMEARQRGYARLREWADHLRLKLYRQDAETVRDDLARIRIEPAPSILNTHMPPPLSIEEERRTWLGAQLLNAEVEYLHYSLLLDPNRQFNETYYNLANDRVLAYREEQMAMFQAEMWRVLHDPYAFEFIEIPPRTALIGRGEQPIMVLRRAAQTIDAIYWLVRFFLRKEYERAIELANQIEETVANLKNDNERHAWSHTMAEAERGIWREYAVIYQGKNVQQAVARLEEFAQRLEALSQVDVETLVFPEKGEKGFIGHPAYPRLLFVVATAYHNLGYGYTTLGDFQKAVHAYTTSLGYTRRLPSPLPLLSTQEATTRNNLSRVLAEMGKKRAVRVCRDALELRIRLGDWLPIAYSFNTLGLIMNDLYQPQGALQACAVAWAIGQQVQDPRLLGLVLLQLGEALRRLAVGVTGPDSPERLYREAARALEQARELFLKSEAGGEGVRIIEANIEAGCLYRDWMGYTDKDRLPDAWKRRRDRALHYLTEAAREAGNSKLVRLELDAQVNIGWTYYLAGEYAETKVAVQKAERLIPPGSRFEEHQPPPDRQAQPAYCFKQLSKIYSLRGLMAITTFTQGTAELEVAEPNATPAERQQLVHRNETLQAHLHGAAEAYVQALGYAELFSPRSVFLTVIYDVLYDFLKHLNSVELEDFYRYEREASQKYRIREIQAENFGELEGFLLDCFGDYYEPQMVGM